jgi:hypothetical protein
MQPLRGEGKGRCSHKQNRFHFQRLLAASKKVRTILSIFSDGFDPDFLGRDLRKVMSVYQNVCGPLGKLPKACLSHSQCNSPVTVRLTTATEDHIDICRSQMTL